MDLYEGISGSLSLEDTGVVPLVALALAIVAFGIWTYLAQRGRYPSLYERPAFSFFRTMASRTAEAGGRFHLAVARTNIGTASTAEAMVALNVLEYLCERAIVYDSSLLVHIADPATLAAAQGVVQRSRRETAHDRSRGDVRLEFVSPQPLAYALGVRAGLESAGPDLTGSLGMFGPEYQIVGEANVRKAIPELAGTTIPETLPLMYVSAEETLVGEELFAAGAFLHHPLHLGSLVAEDVLRAVLVLSIVLGILLRSLGLGG